MDVLSVGVPSLYGSNNPMARVDSTSLNATNSSFDSSYAVAQANSSSLTSDSFYKLLAAQLQNQDPLEGTDSTQMVLQMAQMAQIEQLNNLNSNFATFMEQSMVTGGADFVGKDVVIGAEDGSTIKGTVSEVGFSSSGMLLKVDGTYHPIWRIISVGNGSLNNSGSAQN